MDENLISCIRAGDRGMDPLIFVIKKSQMSVMKADERKFSSAFMGLSSDFSIVVCTQKAGIKVTRQKQSFISLLGLVPDKFMLMAGEVSLFLVTKIGSSIFGLAALDLCLKVTVAARFFAARLRGRSSCFVEGTWVFSGLEGSFF